MKNFILSFVLLIGLVFIAGASAPPPMSVTVEHDIKIDKVTKVADQAFITAVYTVAVLNQVATSNSQAKEFEVSRQLDMQKIYHVEKKAEKYIKSNRQDYENRSQRQSTQPNNIRYRC